MSTSRSNSTILSDCLATIRFTAPFRVQKNLLQVPFSFHRQWVYRYPKYVLFHYDGNKYFIRVRRHSGKCFFADGLKEFRRAHDLNESVILHCVASNKNTTFSVYVIEPTQRQLRVKPLISKRRYIFTADVIKDMIQRTLPLQQLQDLSMLQRNLSPFNADWQNAPTRTSPSIMMSHQLPTHVFYYRFDDHAWELLVRKDIEWENDDINFEEM
ncbi:hypothetical protein GmHk_07G019884 [Glycine max]|nr:hypothetical protein GmHk_07G019884 [Glycine max]